MAIEMTCPHCGHTLSIPYQYSGQAGKCNWCKGKITVPTHLVDPVDEPESAQARSRRLLLWGGGIVAVIFCAVAGAYYFMPGDGTTTQVTPVAAAEPSPAANESQRDAGEVGILASDSKSSATDEIESGGVPWIEWDEQTLTLVESPAGYGRMIRLQSGRILCTYDRGGKTWGKFSVNDGKTWGSPVLIAQYAFGFATNPEILQLQSGTILCSYNERPTPVDGRHPFSIMLTSSSDEGRSWSVPKRLYEAGTQFENGCWEPAMIELPDGEVQLFFANESPYRSSGEQEISMISSKDGAKTWGVARRVSFRRGNRDGMPVPLVLADGKGIVFAIEDNGFVGKFKPVIIYSSLETNWKGQYVDGSSTRRWLALETPLPANVNAAAPYLRQMPTGETVLSVQSTEGGRTQPQMVVYIGDRSARSFAGRSVPFQVAKNTACLWNSLFIKDERTVTAVSGTRINGVAGLWSIDGHIRRDGTPPLPREARVGIDSIWQHRVDDGPPGIIELYSNGRINDPEGPNTWSIQGRSLILRWPNEQAPGGAWVDRCVLSVDGRTYTGANQNENRITGELFEIQE